MVIHRKKHDKFEQMREDAIERILTAAKDLFATNGYAATTIQMIAKQANLVPSGIYHYFAGKDDLLEAVLDREIAEIDKTLNNGLRYHLSGEQDFFDYMKESVYKNRDRISLLCHLVQFRCVPEYCSDKLRIVNHFNEIIDVYIMDPVQRETARNIIIDFISCAVFYAIAGHRDVFERQVEDIRARVTAKVPSFGEKA